MSAPNTCRLSSLRAGRVRRTGHLRRRRAFSLVEMVMVITIIGMISSMAIPRISRGASGASDASLAGDLAVVRRALNMYWAEHNCNFPGPNSARFIAQMTQYSDGQGNTSPSRSTTFVFGPYLLRVPTCPIGENAGSATILIDAANSPPKADPSTRDGWVYNPTTGEFYANTASRSQAGVTLMGGS